MKEHFLKVTGLLAVAALCAALLLPAAVVADQGRPGEVRPEQLWKAYPLGPRPSGRVPWLRPNPPHAATASAPAGASAGKGVSLAVVLGLSLALGFAAGLAGWRARRHVVARKRAASAPAPEPPPTPAPVSPESSVPGPDAVPPAGWPHAAPPTSDPPRERPMPAPSLRGAAPATATASPAPAPAQNLRARGPVATRRPSSWVSAPQASPVSDPWLDDTSPMVAPRVPWPEETSEFWRCEVIWDGRPSVSRFRVVATEPGRREQRVVAETEPFEYRLDREPDPRARTFRGALRPLVRDLQAAGWEPVERGARWWSVRFIWPHAKPPPARLAPAPDELRERVRERA
jgi:hypothetical protein